MERRPPLEGISYQALIDRREKQVEECVEKCEEAQRRLDYLKERAGSGDIKSTKQLAIEGPQLRARIDEYRERASRIVASPII